MEDVEKIAELSELLREIRACIARSMLMRDERERSRTLLSACRIYDKLTVERKKSGTNLCDIGTRLREMMWILHEIRYYEQPPMQDLLREFSD